MIIERDVGITMDDGLVLRADVFRPEGDAKAPVVMAMGPYGKGLPFQAGYAPEWKRVVEEHPDVLKHSSCSYVTWETVDPERWVPFGYAVVHVDSRGMGRSPGYLNMFSARETQDYFECIEWAGTRPWTSGKVGLCGISYYAINQWMVAALQPSHLAAIIPWEGASDFYREESYHGGIFSNVFKEFWYPLRILDRQHGKGSRGWKDPWLNDWVAGPETLTESELEANRVDYVNELRRHSLEDGFFHSRTPDLGRVMVPLLSAANWGGLGLHARGNFEGFVLAGSSQKWLEVHVGMHEELFYSEYGLDLQKRFFDHFLKGADNGWDREPRVALTVRYVDHFEQRKENEWPLARTNWTRIYLGAQGQTLTWGPPERPGKLAFEAEGDGLTFASAPLQEKTEITGPMAARLYVSSSTEDADLFLTFRAFGPGGNEVDFRGAMDSHTPLSQGWLRASHRKIDAARSKAYRPYHTHDEVRKLNPSMVYELNVELWPTCVVLPAGHHLALTVQGRDFERKESKEKWKGSGPFLHNDPFNRPKDVFNGTTEIYTGANEVSCLLLPLIPK